MLFGLQVGPIGLNIHIGPSAMWSLYEQLLWRNLVVTTNIYTVKAISNYLTYPISYKQNSALYDYESACSLSFKGFLHWSP